MQPTPPTSNPSTPQDSEQDKPLASAESAQHATETEAQRRVRFYFGGTLDLRGCDLKDVKLPESIGGWLYLRGCDLKDVKLPESIGGSLDLGGCDLKDVKLPESIGGSLYLSGCDLKDVKLPESIGGSLDVSGCDLKDVKLPESIGGFAMPSRREQESTLKLVASLALAAPKNLKMSDVHFCETQHCIAGWSTASHPLGEAMEEKLGWETAGLMLLGAEAFSHFFSDNETARKFLQTKLAEAA